MKKVEYSQIVRRKLKNLKARLAREFGAEVSRKSVMFQSNHTAVDAFHQYNRQVQQRI